MEEWKECTIGDVCNTISDTYRGNAKDVVLINTSDVLEGKCLNHQKTPNKNLKGQFKKTFQQGDILYSEIRPANKRYAYVNFAPKDYIASTKLMVIRHNDKITPQYLFYILTNDVIIRELQMIAESRSGTFPQVTFSELANFSISLPPISQQKEIVAVFKSLDDKIELNRRINDNLEQQAQALFNEMFPHITEGENMIGNLIMPKRGKGLLSKNAIKGDIPVVAGGIEPATYHNQANTTAPVLTIAASGANAGYINLWHIPVWASDSSYIDDSITPNVYFWYIMLKKRQKEIFDAQVGSAQPHIYPKHIAELPMNVVFVEKIAEYNEIVTPIFEKKGQLYLESKRLTSLRDTLLPKLMSGELKINDINN